MLVALVAVATAELSRSHARAEPASEGLQGEYSIGREGRFIFLPVHLDDRDVLCLLDTGASLTGFDVNLRPLLGERRQSKLLETPGGRTRVETFNWPRATLGGKRLWSPKPVVAIDLEGLRQATNENILGVIGMDLLATARFEVDFDRGRLKFFDRLSQPEADNGIRIPIRLENDMMPYIAGKVGDDGFEEEFLIDTGTQGNSLADQIFDDLADEGQIHLGRSFASVTVAGETRGQRGRLEFLSVGPFAHRGLRFSRLPMSSLGLRYFSRYTVTFDFPEKCLYLRQGTTSPKTEPRATSGLMLKWVDGMPRVDGIRQKGPAAAAGVTTGDTVLEVNGTAAVEFDPFALRELLTSEPGKKISLTIQRGRRRIPVEFVLAED